MGSRRGIVVREFFLGREERQSVCFRSPVHRLFCSEDGRPRALNIGFLLLLNNYIFCFSSSSWKGHVELVLFVPLVFSESRSLTPAALVWLGTQKWVPRRSCWCLTQQCSRPGAAGWEGRLRALPAPLLLRPPLAEGSGPPSAHGGSGESEGLCF